jgi:hypothetical protein
MAKLLYESFMHSATELIESCAASHAFPAYLLRIYLFENNEKSPNRLRPLNFEYLLGKIFTGKIDLKISKELFNDDLLLDQIKSLIIKSGDEGIAYSFLATISNHRNADSTSFLNWIKEMRWTKSANFHKRLFSNFVAILRHNSHNDYIVSEVIEKFPDEILMERCLDEPFQNLSEALHHLKIINPALCNRIINCIQNDDLILRLSQKVLDSTFQGLAFGLHTLNGVDKHLTDKIIDVISETDISIKVIVEKIGEGSFRGLGQVFNNLNSVSTLFVQRITSFLLNDENIIGNLCSKCFGVSFDGFGQALLNLSVANMRLAKRIAKGCNTPQGIEKLLSQCYKDSILGMASGLNNLHTVDSELAAQLLDILLIDNNVKRLSNHCLDFSFENIAQAINNFNNVSDQLAVKISKQIYGDTINLSEIMLLINNSTFEAIGQGVRNIHKVSPEFAAKIILHLDTYEYKNILLQKAAIASFKGFSQGLNNLNMANSEFSNKVIFEIIGNKYLSKILLEKLQKENLEGIGQSIKNLYKISPDLALQFTLPLYSYLNELINKSINVNFLGFSQALQNLYYVDSILIDAFCERLFEHEEFSKIISNKILVKTKISDYSKGLNSLLKINRKLTEKIYYTSPLKESIILGRCLELEYEEFIQTIQPFCILSSSFGKLALQEYNLNKLVNDLSEFKNENLINLLLRAMELSGFSQLEMDAVFNLLYD